MITKSYPKTSEAPYAPNCEICHEPNHCRYCEMIHARGHLHETAERQYEDWAAAELEKDEDKLSVGNTLYETFKAPRRKGNHGNHHN